MSRYREIFNDRPVVEWRCGKRHSLLQVYKTRGGWRVHRERFPVPMQDWLDRTGSGWTVDDIRERRELVMNARQVGGPDKVLPLDIDRWPSADRFEIGCRCKAVWVGLDKLAEDCRRARAEHRTIERKIG